MLVRSVILEGDLRPRLALRVPISSVSVYATNSRSLKLKWTRQNKQSTQAYVALPAVSGKNRADSLRFRRLFPEVWVCWLENRRTENCDPAANSARVLHRRVFPLTYVSREERARFYYACKLRRIYPLRHDVGSIAYKRNSTEDADQELATGHAKPLRFSGGVVPLDPSRPLLLRNLREQQSGIM